MHAGRHYSFQEIAVWTSRETLIFLLAGTIPTLLAQLAGWTWLTLPWLPIALIGTAVAFITGFKNSASYTRLGEARQIWGDIHSSSRAWGMLVLDLPPNVSRKRLVHRHIAWLSALRFQLREPKNWENMGRRNNVEYQRNYRVEEWTGRLDAEFARLIDPAEAAAVLAHRSRAFHLLALQAVDLRALTAQGGLSEYRHIEMERCLADLFTAQAKCERLKNSPYPRQFTTLNLFFVWLFIALVPFGLIHEFQKMGAGFVWVTIPATVIVAWVFHTMDKVGEISENPFEGGPNDVPITALSRAIEIDLREMLGEREIPPPMLPVNNILM